MAGKLRAIAVLGTIVCALAGCGAKESSNLKAAPGEVQPGDKLRGTYVGTVKKSDLPPNPPPQLTRAAAQWQLTLAASGGGTSNTPKLTLSNKKTGVYESVRFGVETDTMVLHELCHITSGQVISLYRYKLTGSQLKITPFKNGCKDKLTEALLTTHPWKKQGG